MARLYADATGALLRFLTTDQTAQYPDTPPGATQTLDFDETTNTTTVSGLAVDWNGYRLLSGQLQYNGQAVTIAAPSAAYTQRQQVYQQAQAIIGNMTTYLGNTSPTAAQTVAQVQENTRVLRWFVRHFVLGQG